MRAHVLSTKLNSILKDNKFDRFVSGKKRGEMDFQSLAKINFSGKIFKQREARKNKDYKVIVLADASGSMSGTPAMSVKDSLDFLSEALEKTDVEYSLWSFAGDVICLKDFNEKKKNNVGDMYIKHHRTRVLNICTECGVAWGSYQERGSPAQCISCKNEYSVDTHNGSAYYNADGLALHLAQERIEEEGGHHIIIMLSDGEADAIPNKYDTDDTAKKELTYMQADGLKYHKMKLDDVVKSVIKKGTTLCSIGILSDDVREHYPKENTIVIEHMRELGDALVKLISKNIHRG